MQIWQKEVVEVLNSPIELAEIAMNIEKNGLAFYTALASKAQGEKVKEIFSFMAEEEKEHYTTFKKLKEKLIAYGVLEPLEEEYRDYVQELVDSNVFSKDIDAAEQAAGLSDPVEAINLALGFEKDSVIFFLQFRKAVPEDEKFVVEELIAEENHHINRLLVMRKAIIETPEEFYQSHVKIGDAER